MSDFETISAKELDGLIHKKNCFIIDLRMPDEYMESHIKGAVNIPYYRLAECRSLPADMELILYCARGSASMMAARELAEKGYHVKTVVGGIHAYRGRYLESYR
ncbi:MAG: rhodanese-like domain-containing protein [Eubacteriales bacterium]|nr:rhodanese-like domain-containing protein [Eubacteriales bacterium]